jgi:pimeloyl-ACP methyl ester carboxylesterase
MRHLLLATAIFTSPALLAQTSAFVSTDPAPDPKHPARLVEIAVPSHGEQLLGALYLAAGEEPHPTVIFNHGFPGFEQNLDLAQALRRAGYNVLALHYRGSWGVKGDFSYTHALEDADAEVSWVTSSDIAAKYNVDTKRIILMGHSLGGFIAASATAHHPHVAALVLISSASIGHRFADSKPEDREKAIDQYASKASAVEFLALAGTSPAALGGESFDHRAEWELYNFAPAIGKRPVLLVTANDGTGPNSEALRQALEHGGSTQVKLVEIDTDHSFSDHRIALESTIIEWLNQQEALRSIHAYETGSVILVDDPICKVGNFSCKP